MPTPTSRRPAVRPAGVVAHLWRTLARELGKFGTIGAVAYVVDVGLFNLLWHGTLGVGGWLADKPLTAKVVSVVVATSVAWGGNRWWTFRTRRAGGSRRVLPELLLFFAMNGAALGISLVCLGFTVYVLGLRGPVAANVSANIVGVGLGTVFRFYAYRTWVFRHRPAPASPHGAAVAAGVAVPLSEPAAPAG